MIRSTRRPHLVIATVAVVIAVMVIGVMSLGFTWLGPSGEPPIGPAAGQPVAAQASQALPADGSGQPATPRPTGSVASPTATPAPPASPTPPSATPGLVAALDARLERLRAKYGMPGISAAIVFADGTSWQGTAGLADVAAGRPVTTDTAFSVASVSKTFTSALILALIEDGRLSLEFDRSDVPA